MTAPDPGGAAAPRPPLAEDATVEIVEERIAVSKRRVPGDAVRVSTRTETVEAVAEVELDRYRVEVTRVAVGRVVDEAPAARAEGDTTIVPVLEERFVVVKQLFLREELHIRHVVEREIRREPVALRRQSATVERLAPAGDGDAGGGQRPAERAAAAGSPQATKAPLR